jgi:hypothetical protein
MRALLFLHVYEMDSRVIYIIFLFCIGAFITNYRLDAGLFLAAIAGISLLLVVRSQYEFFGMSPGTMDQLNSMSSPSQSEFLQYLSKLPPAVRKDITSMTGADPGVLLSSSYTAPTATSMKRRKSFPFVFRKIMH